MVQIIRVLLEAPLGAIRHGSVRQAHVLMHGVILGVDGGVVDHIDGNGLNNVRSNLRAATHAQNIRNAKRQRGTSSCYKGVSWDRANNLWRAGIRVNYLAINLGRFDSEIEAAQAYDEAAKKYFGEFAHLNFPATTAT